MLPRLRDMHSYMRCTLGYANSGHAYTIHVHMTKSPASHV